MIRPQMKKQKQEKSFANELKKGAKVITKSGMHAKLLELNDDGTCVLETSAGKMKYERSAISMEMSNKLNAPAPEKKK
jgi:preprotein translocase subunit YajC|tara:strand:- start:573 stop:806 length:234 start_codon:yes stop_codon:yes gene_type:complete